MSPGSTVRIDVLGSFRLTVDDHPVEVPRSSTRLLAWFVVQPTRWIRRETVAARVWPDLDETKARARLSQSLWTLKQRTPDAVSLIDASPTELGLSEHVVTDLSELKRLGAMTEASDTAETIDWAQFAPVLLEDWDEDWLIEPRSNAALALDTAMSSHIDWLVARDELHAAVSLARDRTELLPSVESGWRTLLGLHDQMADVGAARSAFARMSVRLAEVGSVPSPDLAAADQQRATRVSGEAAPALSDRLIGRGQERAELLEKLELSGEGFGSLAVVCGESGIGKSRLLDELVFDARWRGLRPGRSICSDVEVPFQPLSRAIELAIAPIEVAVLSETLDKPWLIRAARLLPSLPWPDGISVQDAFETASIDEDDRQIQTLIEVLMNVVRRRTVALVIDDFHLADRWTVAAVHRLSELCGDLALLLVLGFRTDPVAATPHPELQRLDVLPNASRISLRGLNQRGTYELARQLDERITRAGAEQLMLLTGGSPFLIRHVVDQAGDGGAGLSPESFAAAAKDPVGDKLHERPALQLEVVQVLAVAEEGLDVFALTSSCSGAAPESVAVAVLALTAERLVTEQAGRYRIAHDRIRVAALGAMSTDSLQRISAGLLRLRHHSGTPAAAARLATRAADWGRATSAHASAGRQAAQLGAVSAAAQHYNSAVDAGRLSSLPDPELADLLILLHDMHALAADVQAQREVLEQLARLRLNDRWVAVTLRSGWHALDNGSAADALTAASEVLDAGGWHTSIRGSAFRLRAEARLKEGQADLSISELRSDLEAAADGPSAHRAELLAALADSQREASEGDLGLAALSASADLLASEELLDQLTDAERGLGMRLVHSGRTEEGFDRMQSALRSAQRLGDRRRNAYCLYSLGSAHLVLLDRYGRGRTYLREALDLAHATSYPEVGTMSLNNLGFADAVILGRIGSGIDQLNEGNEIAAAGGLVYWQALTMFSRAEVALRSADEDAAIELYETVERAFVKIGSPQPLEQVLADQAVLRARIGDFDAAERLIDRSIAVLRSNAHEETNARVQLSFAQARLARGDLGAAAHHARTVSRNFVPGVLEQHYLLWQASEVLAGCSLHDEADVHLGLAGRYLHRMAQDFEPNLRVEVMDHHAQLVSSVLGMERRCTVVESLREDGSPGGIRLDVAAADLARLSTRSRAPILTEIASAGSAQQLQPSRTHMSELFGISDDELSKEWPGKLAQTL